MKKLITIFLLIISTASHSALITVKLKSINISEMTIFVYRNDAIEDKQKIVLNAIDGKFQFEFNVIEPCVVRLSDGTNFIFGILENSDSIDIAYDIKQIKSTFKAKGNGASKFFPDIRSEIHSKFYEISKSASRTSIDQYLRQINEFERVLLDSLQVAVPERNESGRMVKGYCKAIINYLKRRLIVKVYPDIALTVLTDSFKGISYYLRNEIEVLFTFENELHLSPEYVNDVYYTLLQEYMTLVLTRKASGSTKEKYKFYLRHLPDLELKERVLCLLLSTDFKSTNDTDYLVQFAEKEAQNISVLFSTYLTSLITKYGSLFRKGTAAPLFSLTGVSGNEVTLSDFKGKVVVLDFWFKNCAPCLSFFNLIKPLKEEFRDSAVVFLNISIDSREEWVEALKLFKILGVHTYTNGRRNDHPIIKDYQVNGYPTVCIIDRGGNFFNASPPIGDLEKFRNQIKVALNAK